MLSFLFVLGLLVLSIVAVVCYDDVDHPLWVIGAIGIFVCGVVLLGFIIAVMDGQTAGRFFEEHENLSMQLALSGRMSTFERVELEKALVAHNTRLAGYKVKVQSKFSNWFYSRRLLDLNPLPVIESPH